MKMSKAERKAYNLGRSDGYAEGYFKGYEDGNPFLAIAKAVKELTYNISTFVEDPEFQKRLLEIKEEISREEAENETD